MKASDIPVPKYTIGDTIKFNRKNQEEGQLTEIYDDEGDVIGTIHIIEILIDLNADDEIRYWTEHDDHILEKSVIDKLVKEN